MVSDFMMDHLKSIQLDKILWMRIRMETLSTVINEN